MAIVAASSTSKGKALQTFANTQIVSLEMASTALAKLDKTWELRHPVTRQVDEGFVKNRHKF